MKHIKRFTATCLCSAMLLVSGPAQAATSQFGLSGWPGLSSTCSENACQTAACHFKCENSYGVCSSENCQDSVCGTDCNTACQNVACSICGGYECGDVCQSVFWTAKPITTPETDSDACNTAAPEAQPTQSPVTQVKPAPTASATKTPSQSMGDYTTDSLSAQEQKALNLLNEDRIANGLSPLTADPQLSALARRKSQDMYENNYFSHTSPTYGSAADMLRTFGYSFNSVGENIAHHATVEKSQAAFMSSTGHRRNILGSLWTKVGIGVWTDAQGYVYVTQLFVR